MVSGPSFRRPAEDSPGGRSDPIMIAAAQAGAMAPGDWQARRLVLVPHGGPVPLGRQPKQILPLCGIDGLRAQPEFGRALGGRATNWDVRSSGKHGCRITASPSWGQGMLPSWARRTALPRASIGLGALPPRTTNFHGLLGRHGSRRRCEGPCSERLVIAMLPTRPPATEARPPPGASRN